MTKIRPLTTLLLLLGLFILEPGALWAQQEGPAPITRPEQKLLLPPAYASGIRPFLWERHGADPYYPVPDRNALVELSKKPELINDLTTGGQNFTQVEAEYLQRALANAKNSDSVITEVTLPIGTPILRMRFGHGIKAVAILEGKSEEAWQIILPPETGSKVVWFPKVCGNICLSPFLARTVIAKTEVQEKEQVRERVVENPVYISRPVYYPVDRPVFVERPVYQEPGSSCSRCGRTCKIVLGVLAGTGVGAGVYFGTRGRERHQQVVVPYKPPGGGGGVN